ncbi:MAG TPA: Uma2 family endonuclease [Longimicrobium sp.]|jgi:Uma2 family endonuclease
MATTSYATRVTPETYLVRERAARERSEYWDGEVVAMSGAPEPHVLITGNVFATLRARLRGRDCRVYASDMKVRFDEGRATAYPDVVAVRGERRWADGRRDVLLNPTLVVEVLSPSTERHDRGRKTEGYRRVESLAEYLFIAQKDPRVELYRRGAEGEWSLAVFTGMNDEVWLESLGCALRLPEIYEDVE